MLLQLNQKMIRRERTLGTTDESLPSCIIYFAFTFNCLLHSFDFWTLCLYLVFVYLDLIPICFMQVPYVGLNFAVYESLKDWLIKAKPFGLIEDNELSVTTRLACGAAAGTVGQTVAYPLDVIRRRMQMVGWNNAASVVTGDGRGKAPLEYNGMVDAFRKTVRHEGFGALYKGLIPNSVKVSLTSLFVICFHVYGVIRLIFFFFFFVG